MLYTQKRGHKLYIEGIDIDSSGQLLASASQDRSVRIWNLNLNGLQMHVLKEMHVLEGYEPMETVKFSPNGYHVAASCADGRVWVWASHDGRKIATLRDASDSLNSFCPVNFINNETILFAGGRGSIEVWQFGPKGGQFLRTLEQHEVRIDSNTFNLFKIIDELLIETRTLYRCCQQCILVPEWRMGRLRHYLG